MPPKKILYHGKELYLNVELGTETLEWHCTYSDHRSCYVAIHSSENLLEALEWLEEDLNELLINDDEVCLLET